MDDNFFKFVGALDRHVDRVAREGQSVGVPVGDVERAGHFGSHGVGRWVSAQADCHRGAAVIGVAAADDLERAALAV